MKSKRRRLGLLSKAKHAVSNKKYEWEQERKESRAMKVEADAIGKQRAKSAKKKQLERDAEDRYRQKYGISSPRPPSTKKVKEYDPFGWQDL